jgi:Zn-dependent peptidase ImmA (M78 family)/transcriptional regulator with XRE-family HTH domain
MNELAINLMRLRKLNGLTQQAVAEAAGISRVAYRNLEKGTAEPRRNTLDKLASTLNASVFDLLAPVPELKSLRCRANPNAEMSEQERAMGSQMVVRSANWLNDFNELELLLNKPRQPKLGSVRKGTRPQNAAAKARQMLLGEKADCGCIPDFCELLENSGIKLLLCDFNMTNLFGLSIGKADGGPAIAVNTGKDISVERQIFSLAHELGHLMLHKDTYSRSTEQLAIEDPVQEREADQFAAAFLMPEEQFLEEWNENRGLHWIDAVLKTKRHFKVSYQAVLHQLIDMGKAESPAVYKQFRADYEKRYGKKLHWKEEPPVLVREEPRHLDPLDLTEDRLGTLVRDALDQEQISVSRAAEILGISLMEMRERMKSWRVVK